MLKPPSPPPSREEADVPDPTFWVAVGFLILAALAVMFGRKPVLAMLDARVDAVKASLNEAASLREEAQQLLAEYQRKQRDAVKRPKVWWPAPRKKPSGLPKKVRKTSKNAETPRRAGDGKDRPAEADAVREVRAMSVEIAVDATRVLIAQKLDGSHADALVNEAISDLSQKLH